MFGDIFGYHIVGEWDATDMSRARSGVLLNILQCMRQPSTKKNYLAPNVNSTEVEKLEHCTTVTVGIQRGATTWALRIYK